MEKLNTASRLFFLFAFTFAALGRAEEENRKLALVYRGPIAGCSGCAEAIADVLKNSNHGLDVRFVGPDEELQLTPETLYSAAVYAQPGGQGSAAKASALIEEQLGGKDVLANWVSDGGRYYGTCLGGYMAGKPWSTDAVVDMAAWGFNLLPGMASQWIGSSHATVNDLGEAVVEVDWEGESRWIYFQDGPYFDVRPDGSTHVVATYKSNGLPAAVVNALGRGKVAVVGPHPEANHHWFNRERLEDPSDPDGEKGHALDLARNLIDRLLAN